MSCGIHKDLKQAADHWIELPESMLSKPDISSLKITEEDVLTELDNITNENTIEKIEI